MSHHLITDEATVEINQGKEMCIQNSTVELAAKFEDRKTVPAERPLKRFSNGKLK